jgi:hypothetical protein
MAEKLKPVSGAKHGKKLPEVAVESKKKIMIIQRHFLLICH